MATPGVAKQHYAGAAYAKKIRKDMGNVTPRKGIKNPP
jgi:hypothetical protein